MFAALFAVALKRSRSRREARRALSLGRVALIRANKTAVFSLPAAKRGRSSVPL